MCGLVGEKKTIEKRRDEIDHSFSMRLLYDDPHIKLFRLHIYKYVNRQTSTFFFVAFIHSQIFVFNDLVDRARI